MRMLMMMMQTATTYVDDDDDEEQQQHWLEAAGGRDDVNPGVDRLHCSALSNAKLTTATHCLMQNPTTTTNCLMQNPTTTQIIMQTLLLCIAYYTVHIINEHYNALLHTINSQYTMTRIGLLSGMTPQFCIVSVHNCSLHSTQYTAL